MRIIQYGVAVLLYFIANLATAGYLHGQEPLKIYGNGTISFGVASPPADTCNYYHRHFKFDATTPGGKNMLSILLAAKMANKKVTIWYNASTAPGADQDNGCTTPH